MRPLIGTPIPDFIVTGSDFLFDEDRKKGYITSYKMTALPKKSEIFKRRRNS
jgi:hypothetical protein